MKAFVLSEHWSHFSCSDTNVSLMPSSKIHNALSILCKTLFCTIRGSFRPTELIKSGTHVQSLTTEICYLPKTRQWFSSKGCRLRNTAWCLLPATRSRSIRSSTWRSFEDAESRASFKKATISVKFWCLNEICIIDAIIKWIKRLKLNLFLF